ncbi:hypothetical protein [Tumebacillus lipolyticus]|uniref:Uncharacterized protein n=1 Tax=Tumebacillus lipolyticus TaxID=1280370 RepID=A0ABW4ZT68_9BACL
MKKIWIASLAAVALVAVGLGGTERGFSAYSMRERSTRQEPFS